MAEKMAEFFNSLAADWDASRNIDETKIEGLVAQVGLAAGDRVLDAGTGTGVLLPFIHRRIGNTGHIVAVDFAAAMLVRAQEKYGQLPGISYVESDIMAFSAEEPYDAVICFNFFPHINDTQLFLQKAKKWLRPGGRLAIIHDISRAAVNAIHSSSNHVREDRLPTAEAVGELLCQQAYQLLNAVEDDGSYFVLASC